MHKRRFPFMTAMLTATLLGAGWTALAWFLAPQVERAPLLIAHPGPMQPNGEFRVSHWASGTWNEIGALPAGRFPHAGSLPPLQHEGAAPVRLRIMAQGGGHAHLDHVALAGHRLTGATGAPLAKLRKADNDVVDAHVRPIELEFTPTGAVPREGTALHIVGRIEPVEPGGLPFRYPAENTYRGPFHAGSAYYSYVLGSNPGRLTLDGELAGEALGRPFFANWQRVGSGHPQAPTYGWVRNDTTHLYVAIDFTSDNTVDGDKDYAAVTVNLAAGPRRFPVSVPHQTWGRPGFTYTDRAGWQHKVYEFAIPLAELGVTPGTQPSLQLAFEAYGTSTPPVITYDPRIAFDAANDCFVYVYYDSGGSGAPIIAQVLDEDGADVGSGETVDEMGLGASAAPRPAIAYDPDNGRYLVVWTANGTYDYIRTRLINPNGTSAGSIQDLPEAAYGDRDARVAYDPDNKQFLVVYQNDLSDWRWISGRFVSAAGTVGGTEYDLSPTGGPNGSEPDVAYDPVNDRFIVVWRAGSSVYVQRMLPNGILDDGGPLEIAGTYGGTPAVAVNPTNGTALIAYEYFGNIEAALYDVGDNTTGSPELVNETGSSPNGPSVAYDPQNNQFLVVWEDSDILGRYISSSGSPTGSTIDVHLDAFYDQENPSVAANLLHGGFLVVFSDFNGDTVNVATVAGTLGSALRGGGGGLWYWVLATPAAGLLGLWLLAGWVGRGHRIRSVRLRPVRQALASALVLHMLLLGGLAACAGDSGGGGGGGGRGTSVPTTCQLQ